MLAIGHEEDCTSSHFERVRRQEHKLAEEEAAAENDRPESFEDNTLVAEGYCHQAGVTECIFVMHVPVVGEDRTEDELWTVDTDRVPAGVHSGSFVKLYIGGFRLYEPKWTEEEIAECMRQGAELFERFGDTPLQR